MGGLGGAGRGGGEKERKRKKEKKKNYNSKYRWVCRATGILTYWWREWSLQAYTKTNYKNQLYFYVLKKWILTKDTLQYNFLNRISSNTSLSHPSVLSGTLIRFVAGPWWYSTDF